MTTKFTTDALIETAYELLEEKNFQVAAAMAQIAIAQELKRMNDNREAQEQYENDIYQRNAMIELYSEER